MDTFFPKKEYFLVIESMLVYKDWLKCFKEILFEFEINQRVSSDS